MFLEPRHRIGRGETMKRRNQRSLTARITLAQSARIETVVGDVAAPPSRDSDFRQKFRAAFVDRNFVRSLRLGTGDRRKESSRATADDRDFFRHGYGTS